jgi:hypothetical protein
MHGGAPGSGAPIGNRNALKHGRYTAETIAARRKIRALLRNARDLVAQASGKTARKKAGECG